MDPIPQEAAVADPISQTVFLTARHPMGPCQVHASPPPCSPSRVRHPLVHAGSMRGPCGVHASPSLRNHASKCLKMPQTGRFCMYSARLSDFDHFRDRSVPFRDRSVPPHGSMRGPCEVHASPSPRNPSQVRHPTGPCGVHARSTHHLHHATHLGCATPRVHARSTHRLPV